ncbi:uncharacterized protein B0J16DRAFT_43521 [Fusarium flagelliforme]|uniref:uncharacterized protein n=1 Tax=Fusarium flagelliforme TaxID=2675880 RepID=UPI001E8D5574|nr:uncharacterized protein B0J16DRAFT_43521 [Fusarium flagelliforme]KAH7198684.1 hypothetical protein B0J16DRAFT_43521 [Fusarium flagelliforme]
MQTVRDGFYSFRMARLQQHGLDLLDRRGATIHNVRDFYYRYRIVVSEGQESRIPIAATINTQCRDETQTVFPLHLASALALALASPRFVMVSTGFTPAHPLWGVFLTGGKPRRQRYATLYQSEGRVWLIDDANNKKVAALRAELLQSLGPGWRVGLSTGTQQEQCPPCDLRPRQRWNSPCSVMPSRTLSSPPCLAPIQFCLKTPSLATSANASVAFRDATSEWFCAGCVSRSRSRSWPFIVASPPSPPTMLVWRGRLLPPTSTR